MTRPALRETGPALTVDIIIVPEHVPGGVVLVERKYPPLGWALPGGFVDAGETVESAAVREAREETGLEVTLQRQFHVYSDPSRDSRRHTVSVVFVGHARGEPVGADDAARAAIFSAGELPELAFDHAEILRDYFGKKY